jgi:hypothetical protein
VCISAHLFLYLTNSGEGGTVLVPTSLHFSVTVVKVVLVPTTLRLSLTEVKEVLVATSLHFSVTVVNGVISPQ